MTEQLTHGPIWKVRQQNEAVEKEWIAKYPDLKDRILNGVRKVKELEDLYIEEFMKDEEEDIFLSSRLLEIDNQLLIFDDLVTVWEKNLYYGNAEKTNKAIAGKQAEAESQRQLTREADAAFALLEKDRMNRFEENELQQFEAAIREHARMLPAVRRMKAKNTGCGQQLLFWNMFGYLPKTNQVHRNDTKASCQPSTLSQTMSKPPRAAQLCQSIESIQDPAKQAMKRVTDISENTPLQESDPSFTATMIAMLQQTQKTIQEMESINEIMADVKQRKQVASNMGMMFGNKQEQESVDSITESLGRLGLEAHKYSENCVALVEKISKDAMEMKFIVKQMKEYALIAQKLTDPSLLTPVIHERMSIEDKGLKKDGKTVTDDAKVSSRAKKLNGKESDGGSENQPKPEIKSSWNGISSHLLFKDEDVSKI